MADFGTTKPRGKPTSRRRRGAGAVVFLVMAMIAGLVFVAVQADGRELSRTTANDGGAWVVSREYGAVAHMNRATGELSSFVRIPDSPNIDVFQAEGIVVAHDSSTNLVFEVDQRVSTEDVAPTQLPDFTQVIAVDYGLVVYRTQPSLAVWQISATELSGLTSLEGQDALISAAGPGLVAADPSGALATVEAETGLLHWFDGDIVKLGSFDLELIGDVIDVSLVEDRVAVLTDLGELVMVGVSGVEHRTAWDAVVPNADGPALLQRSSVGANPGAASTGSGTGSVAVISQSGELVEVTFDEQGAQGVVRGSLAGAEPLAPIVHDGCVYAVVTEPPTFASACDEFDANPIDRAGSQLRLRLVNGWIWVNDAESGVTYAPDESLILEEFDVFGLAIESASDEESEDEPEGGALPSDEDDQLIDDPDADGEVREDDEFDASEVNFPPTAIDDEAQTRIDQTTVVEVLANDTDPNNDVLAVVEVEVLSGDGVVSITPAGTATQVNPAAGFTGVIEYRYAISDGLSEPVSALVTVVVQSDDDNQAPIAETDVVPTTAGEPQTINVLANDFDPDGDAIFLQSITSDVGTLRWDPSGLITFTADSTIEAGWVELPYVVADSFGAEGEGRVRIQIRDSEANQEPDARNDQLTTVVGQPVSTNLLANDIDPDGDPLIIGSQPRLIQPADAVVRANATPDGEFVFAADVAGTYIFTYTINDAAPDGSESDTARIRVDVLPDEGNTPPIAVRDDIVIPVGETRAVRVLDNDGDPDGDVIAIVNWTVSPGLIVTELNDETGHIGFDITLTTAAGPSPEMTYAISDGVSPPVVAPVVIAIAARTSNDQPPLAKDDVQEGRPGQQIEISVLDNDSDPEGQPLRIVSVGESPLATVTIPPEASTLLVAIPEDAVSSFSVPYDIEDIAGNRASANLRVQLITDDEPNRPPVARTDEQRTRIDTPVVINVLDNDSDPDSDPITLAGILEQPQNGTARPNVDGSILYTPDPSFTGTDVLTYAIIDSSEDSALGQVFIGVMEEAPQNLPPIANDDAAQVTAPVSTPIDVLDNDLDPEGDPIRIVDVSAAEFGTVTFDGVSVSYTPPAINETEATDTFTYVIADSAGNQDDATVTIGLDAYSVPEEEQLEDELVEPEEEEPEEEELLDPEEEPTPEPTPDEINLAPVAVDDNPPPGEPGSLIGVEVLANDSDPDGDVADLIIVSAGDGAFIDGDIVFVTVGSEPTEVAYTIADPAGAEASAVINVRPLANGVPVAVDDNPPPAEPGTELVVDVLANDSDPDGDVDDLTIISVGAGARIDGRAVVVEVGDAAAQIPYTIADGRGAEATAFINVRVISNGGPVAVDDNPPPTRTGTELVVDVLANDSDPDGDVDDLTIISVGAGARIDGRTVVVEVGDADAQIPYTIADDRGAEASAFINVSVVANGLPVARDDDPVPAKAGSRLIVDVLENDFDTDGDVDDLTIISVGGGASIDGRTVVIDVGDDAVQIPYAIADADGGEATAFINVRVIANAEPVLVPLDVVTEFETSITLNLGAQVTDPDDDPLFFVCCDDVRGGSVNVDIAAENELVVTFTPEPDFVGVGGFNYTVDDQQGHRRSGSVSVRVGAPDNRPPETLDDSVEVLQRAQELVDLARLTSDPDDDDLTYSIVTPPAAGVTVQITGSTAELAVQDGVEVGTTGSFVYEVSDGILTAQGQIDFTVTEGENRPPVVVDTTLELQAATGQTVDLNPLTDEPDLGDSITWSLAGSPPEGLTVEISGSLVSITADPDAAGTTADIGFIAADTRGGEANGVIAVTVVETTVADPTATDDVAPPAAPQEVVEIDVLANDIDPLGERLTLVSITTPTIGSAAIQGDKVIFTTDEGETGVGTMTYVMADAAGREATGTITVEVVSAPDQPAPPDAEAASTQVTITWETPKLNGAVLTGYRITPSIGDPVEVGVQNSYVWNGLTNGTQYNFTVTALSNLGDSPESGPSPDITPNQKPERPSSPSVTSEDGSLFIEWQEPTNLGSEILDYEIRIGGNLSETRLTGGLESYRWEPLQNGDNYTFEIRAMNAAGWSPWSTSSGAETPAGRPDAPTIGTTVRSADSGALDVNWSKPISDNGAQIIEYFVRVAPDGTPVPVAGEDTLNMLWSNLANGVEVAFQVQARNSAGSSDWSAASNLVKPCGRPDAPTIENVQRGDQQATIEWAEPAQNGCDVTGYWISAVGSGQEFPASTLSRDYLNLVNGTPYRFTVQAENEQGRSVLSVESPQVIPAGPPIFCPTSGTTWASPISPGGVVVGWDEAIANGDPVTNYQVRVDGGAWQDHIQASIASQGPVPIDHFASGLANDTTYSFEVRAINTVGTSTTTCGPVSAKTWALPSPMTRELTYNAEILGWTLDGAESPDTPITSATHTITRDGEVYEGPTAGLGGLGFTVNRFASADGDYSGTTQVCNAVGCVDYVANTVTVVLPKPPDQVPSNLLIASNGQERHATEGIWSNGTFYGHFLGAELQLKVVHEFPVPDNKPTEYDYEIERRNGPSAGWVLVESGTEAYNEGGSWTYFGAFDQLLGYSDHPNGMNGGEQWTWRARTKARNAVGEAPWSDWVETDVDLWTATFQLDLVSSTACNDGGSGPLDHQCMYINANFYGYPANTTYTFGGGSGGGGLEASQAGTSGCISSVTTDAHGRSLPGKPLGEHDLYCSSPINSQVRLYTANGDFTSWVDASPS